MKTIVMLYTGDTTLAASGGTEKVFANMAKEFIRRGYRVIGITNDDQEVKSFFPLPRQMLWFKLGLHDFRLPFTGKIRRELNRISPFCIHPKLECRAVQVAKQVDKMLQAEEVAAIICYEFEAVVAANRLHLGRAKKIAMLHNAVAPLLGTLNKWELAEENRMDVLQVLAPSYIAEAAKFVKTRIIYIPNVVESLPRTNSIMSEHEDKHIIIAIGRLDHIQKRPHLLIQAFARVVSRFPDWQVHVYGMVDKTEQDYELYLQALIKKLNLTNKVFLKGTTEQIKDKLYAADLFAIPSAYEGFPLAMTEAMSAGLPVVGFAVAPGVKDLLRDGETGILCAEGVEGFAKGIERLMLSSTLRYKIGQAGRNSLNSYGPQEIWNQWGKLISDDPNMQ